MHSIVVRITVSPSGGGAGGGFSNYVVMLIRCPRYNFPKGKITRSALFPTTNIIRSHGKADRVILALPKLYRGALPNRSDAFNRSEDYRFPLWRGRRGRIGLFLGVLIL
jgi:hypothetical protein